MNGCVIPRTPIAVDFWKLRECPQAKVFFLTHLHGDHITGLTSSWHYPIYCSEITSQLLRQRYGLKEGLIRPLETDRGHIVYLDEEREEQMIVTPIDANHCPGAVMYLFEGYFGTILHTGDFRLHPDMLESQPLCDLAGKIDVLYLDNTYCSPACVFPSRAEAMARIIQIVRQHQREDIVIGLRSLGKEDLLVEIAMETKEWISVPGKVYETLQVLNAPDVFRSVDEGCRIRVVPFHLVSNRNMARWNDQTDTIAILPSALYFGLSEKPFENHDKVFVVPYSDHSSYPEIVKFVSFLKPAKIIPVVRANARGPFGKSISDRADMSQFKRFLSADPHRSLSVPASVQRHMHGRRSYSPVLGKGGCKRKGKQLKRPGSSKQPRRGVYYDSVSPSQSQSDPAVEPQAAIDRTSSVLRTAARNLSTDYETRTAEKDHETWTAEKDHEIRTAEKDHEILTAKKENVASKHSVTVDAEQHCFLKPVAVVKANCSEVQSLETATSGEQAGCGSGTAVEELFEDVEAIAGHTVEGVGDKKMSNITLSDTIQESQGFFYCENTSTPNKRSPSYTNNITSGSKEKEVPSGESDWLTCDKGTRKSSKVRRSLGFVGVSQTKRKRQNDKVAKVLKKYNALDKRKPSNLRQNQKSMAIDSYYKPKPVSCSTPRRPPVNRANQSDKEGAQSTLPAADRPQDAKTSTSCSTLKHNLLRVKKYEPNSKRERKAVRKISVHNVKLGLRGSAQRTVSAREIETDDGSKKASFQPPGQTDLVVKPSGKPEILTGKTLPFDESKQQHRSALPVPRIVSLDTQANKVICTDAQDSKVVSMDTHDNRVISTETCHIRSAPLDTQDTRIAFADSNDTQSASDNSDDASNSEEICKLVKARVHPSCVAPQVDVILISDSEEDKGLQASDTSSNTTQGSVRAVSEGHPVTDRCCSGHKDAASVISSKPVDEEQDPGDKPFNPSSTPIQLGAADSCSTNKNSTDVQVHESGGGCSFHRSEQSDSVPGLQEASRYIPKQQQKRSKVHVHAIPERHGDIDLPKTKSSDSADVRGGSRDDGFSNKTGHIPAPDSNETNERMSSGRQVSTCNTYPVEASGINRHIGRSGRLSRHGEEGAQSITLCVKGWKRDTGARKTSRARLNCSVSPAPGRKPVSQLSLASPVVQQLIVLPVTGRTGRTRTCHQ